VSRRGNPWALRTVGLIKWLTGPVPPVRAHLRRGNPYDPTQTNAFKDYVGQIIQPSWLSMFNQSELPSYSGYRGVYDISDDKEEHPSTVKLFWGSWNDKWTTPKRPQHPHHKILASTIRVRIMQLRSIVISSGQPRLTVSTYHRKQLPRPREFGPEAILFLRIQWQWWLG